MSKVISSILFISLCAFSGIVSGQPHSDSAAYQKTVNARSDKIVSQLALTDSLIARKVSHIIAQHYLDLNEIYHRRDSLHISQAETDAAVLKIHQPFLQKLLVYLDHRQVIKVKDGLTYGVLPLTFAAYQDMLPQLTQVQKDQILMWLTEARELAMDAESSEKKHGVFKKYKGRINNYLSAAGIDMKKEGELWQERIRAKGQDPTPILKQH